MLEEIRAAQVDLVVVGGDVVPGPLPRKTIKCLLEFELPMQFICGNGEVAVLEQMAGIDPAEVPEAYRPIIRWTAQEIAEYRELLGAWPKMVDMRIPGLGDVLFCHATPRNENEIFTRETAEERLLPVFEGITTQVVVCGHTHMQFDRMVGRTRVVNAGSVGMPFGEPGADWLLLGDGVELRHTPYDLERAAERILRSGYPQAKQFVASYLLKPPSEQAMLAVFGQAELRYG